MKNEITKRINLKAYINFILHSLITIIFLSACSSNKYPIYKNIYCEENQIMQKNIFFLIEASDTNDIIYSTAIFHDIKNSEDYFKNSFDLVNTLDSNTLSKYNSGILVKPYKIIISGYYGKPEHNRISDKIFKFILITKCQDKDSLFNFKKICESEIKINIDSICNVSTYQTTHLITDSLFQRHVFKFEGTFGN